MKVIQTLSLFFAGVTAVSAGGCTILGCGDVANNTPWKMKWADLGKKDNKCNVYNCWGDGCKDFSENRKNVVTHCKQGWVNPGQHKGGVNNDGIDVDAICFADRIWEMRWKDGRTIPLKAGEWAKINDAQSISCLKIEAPPGVACYETD